MSTPSNHAVAAANKLARAASRCALASEVFRSVYAHTESFNKAEIGTDLAYLLGAIVADKKHEQQVQWPMENPPALLAILIAAFPKNHRVWRYICQDKAWKV